MKSQHTLNRIGTALLIAALAGTTMTATAAATEPKTEESDVLRGPDIAQSTNTDSTDSMTGKADRAGAERPNTQRRAAELPMTAFVNAVRGLNRAAKENPELALTDEQLKQIEEIAESHKAKMDAYLDEHRDELGPMYAPRDDRDTPRAARGAQARGKQNDARTPPPPPERGGDQTQAPEPPQRPSLSRQEMKELRAKRAEILKDAPSDAGAKKEIFALLTSEQRAVVKEHLVKVQESRVRRAKMATGRDTDGERAQRKPQTRGERGSNDKERAPRRQTKEDD